MRGFFLARTKTERLNDKLRNTRVVQGEEGLVAEEQKPVILENGASHAVTVAYQALGESFLRSVVFVSLPEMQLSFRLTARKADFETIQKQFRSSILSWHWTEPHPDTKVAVAKAPTSAN